MQNQTTHCFIVYSEEKKNVYFMPIPILKISDHSFILPLQRHPRDCVKVVTEVWATVTVLGTKFRLFLP